MPTPYTIVRWLHVLSMVGLSGGVLVIQCAIPRAERRDEWLRKAVRLWNILLLIGLLAGVLMYGLARGHTLGAHYNGVVGLKFIILLAVGALLPLSLKSAHGDRLRWLALSLILAASFAAITL